MIGVFATPTDFAAYTGQPEPTMGLMRTAHLNLGVFLNKGFVYTTDETGQPTDPTQVAALREATILQAIYLQQTGNTDGVTFVKEDGYTKVSLGGASYERAGNVATGKTYLVDGVHVPAVIVQVLREAGIVYKVTVY